MVAHVTKRIIGEESRELVRTIREVIEKELGAGYGWPGNVRELEQVVRRVLLTRRITPDRPEGHGPGRGPCLLAGINDGSMSAQRVLWTYCLILYEKFGNYGEVSRRTGLDRRTVKKYVQTAQEANGTREKSPRM